MIGIYANCSFKEYKKLAELGFDTVFCDEKRVKEAKKAGLEAFVVAWTFKSGIKNGIVNSKNEKILWLNAGCPNRVKTFHIQAYNKEIGKDKFSRNIAKLVEQFKCDIFSTIFRYFQRAYGGYYYE